MSRIKSLHNRHDAEQCCVLDANDPLLKNMELGFLKHETTIGLNKIFLGFREFYFFPRYYGAVNGLVIEQSRDISQGVHEGTLDGACTIFERAD